MRHSYCFILLFLCFTSCKVKQSSPPPKTFETLLPGRATNNYGTLILDELKQTADQLGLTRMDTGVSQFELRLWYNKAKAEKHVLVFQVNDTAFHYRHIEYLVMNYGVTKFDAMSHVEKDSLKTLYDSLKQIDFKSLMSRQDIPGFRDTVSNGTLYYMEVATPTRYVLVTYNAPEYYAASEINNKRFLDIILLLNRYLHFYPSN